VGGGGGNWRRWRELLRWASVVCCWCGWRTLDAADCVLSVGEKIHDARSAPVTERKYAKVQIKQLVI